jgi:hypothetical protein
MVPVREGLDVLRRRGPIPFLWESARHLGIWDAAWNTVTSRYPVGTNVFERDWDLLVILDTCRPDSLRHAADSVAWLDDVDSMWSVGSMSAEWMLNTFTDSYRDKISETGFVFRNTWGERIFADRFHERRDHRYDIMHRGRPRWTPVAADDFGYFEMVSPMANQDDSLHPQCGVIPHVLTDRAIAVGREQDLERLVVHYSLPHVPYYADALDWAPGETSMEQLMDGPAAVRDLRPDEESYERVKNGESSVEDVREAYRNNLRLALEYVDVLLQNVDAEKTVISADHGEALGEYGMWSHPFGYPLPPVKTVPWARTTAKDEHTYESKYDPLETTPDEGAQMEQLEQLGYL